MSINNINLKLNKYNVKKAELYILADENKDDKLMDILKDLSLGRPNILWDLMDLNLPSELLAKEIHQAF
jgi:beta-xylosidase